MSGCICIKVWAAERFDIRSLQGPMPEPLVWVYVIQIALALLHIHAAGFAAQAVHPSKILVTYRYRIRLNCVGLVEATKHNMASSTSALQNQDWIELGKLILFLGNTFTGEGLDLATSIEQFLNSTYSGDLKRLLYLLLSESDTVKGDSVIKLMSPRLLKFLEHSWTVGDMLESELKKEIENDRLFRIICKINTIVDRGELMGEGNWSETGNRYIVKLFRDYVFHQIDEYSRPVLDLGHVVDCLNKVDIGTMEKVMLMSQEGASIFIVTFAEMKRCIEKSFTEVVTAATRPPVATS